MYLFKFELPSVLLGEELSLLSKTGNSYVRVQKEIRLPKGENRNAEKK